MSRDTELERYLYDEWKRAQSLFSKFGTDALREADTSCDAKTIEYYERLQELAWTYSVGILEIIYDFEKERGS